MNLYNTQVSGQSPKFWERTRGWVAVIILGLIAPTRAHAQEESRVIIDNAQSDSVEAVGTWTISTGSTQKYGGNYHHDGNTGKGTKTFTFTPQLNLSGEYEVFMRWPAASNYASNVPVDLLHANGTVQLQINQKASGGIWVSLGSYNFDLEQDVTLTLGNAGTNGHVVADAVWFQKKGLTLDDENVANAGLGQVFINGSWPVSNGTPGYYGTGYRHDNNAGKGSKSFRWNRFFQPTGTTKSSYDGKLRPTGRRTFPQKCSGWLEATHTF